MPCVEKISKQKSSGAALQQLRTESAVEKDLRYLAAADIPPSLGGESEVGGLPVTEDAEHLAPIPKSAVAFNLGSHLTQDSNTRSAAFGGYNHSMASGDGASLGPTFPSKGPRFEAN